MKKHKVNAEILFNKEIAPSYFLIRLKTPSVAARARPGQFVNIVCGETAVSFFRRPFDFRKISKSAIEIFYKVVGEGTAWLSRQKKGTLDIIGPLGEGFLIPKKDRKDHTHVILAGGIGVVPLLDIAEVLQKRKVRKIAFLGAREKKLIFYKSELKKLGFDTRVIVDHKRRGKYVFMIDVFREFVKMEAVRGNLQNLSAYSVGPVGMIAGAARIAKTFDVHIQISYEAVMGCGFGVCRGCNLLSKEGYQMICQDGPVFDARTITDDRF